MLSMRVDDDLNPYIASLSRGGLWSPHPWIVSIAEACELIFKNSTDKGMITHLPVETMISKECKLLYLENFIKLYIKVRCFSFAKDVVNKYKLSTNAPKKKALRKELKKNSEEQ